MNKPPAKMAATSAGTAGTSGPMTREAVAKALRQTTALQDSAAAPECSVWVSANAGTGKTHVLVQRVLRLLLAGTRPEHILCLTFTKAAAAVMSNRVFDRLSRWATATDAQLENDLSRLLGKVPSNDERLLARTLFAGALETPGGLKVQTIHAFCERLLQRFPLEAGIAPGFTILDDETRAVMTRDCIDATLNEALRQPEGELGKALQIVVAHSAEVSFDSHLANALQRAEHIRKLLAATGDEDDEAFATLRAELSELLGLRAGAVAAELVAEQADLVDQGKLGYWSSALMDGTGKTDRDNAEVFAQAARLNAPTARLPLLGKFFLTDKGEKRQRLFTKSVEAKYPGLGDDLTRTQTAFHTLSCELKALKLLDASMALLRVADRVITRYEHAKAQRAALDFGDLIARASQLLTQSADAQWVLYKLDNGLDHILVDEAQDTSPEQWSIVQSLAAEFFAGSGAREAVRTVFAVGDEKQSIYGFQGAKPEMFAGMGQKFQQLAAKTENKFERIPLNLSFRTVEPVLAAVDKVFADPAAVPGLSAGDEPISHIAKRFGQGGLVEIWETERPGEDEVGEAWSPLGDKGAGSAMVPVARRVARTIRGWLDQGERLVSQDRNLRAGDILILVRNRRPFAPAVIAALKAEGVPVAGADRIRVTEQIAVEDLVALGDFLLLPEDDLALACVLKSPLFGFDDDKLFSISHQRKGSLWNAILTRAASTPELAPTADTLKRWRAEADYLPPFEFFAKLLDRQNRRGAMLQRLGPEAGDAINEFLNLAIRYDEAAPPSLQGFVDWLRLGAPEIRRDMDQGRNEVRVMTVHGAKGLEAPIVFLPDTCSVGGAGGRGELLALAERPASRDASPTQSTAQPPALAPLVWPISGTSNLAPLAAARAAIASDDRKERHRLLYVAMTRARDRLYVAGYEGRRGREKGCWYDLICEGLAGSLVELETAAGHKVRRLEQGQSEPCETDEGEVTQARDLTELPDWARRPAPREVVHAIPIAPSRMAPLEAEAEPLPAGNEAQYGSPIGVAGDGRFLRGTITHELLQHLPDLPPTERRHAASAYIEIAGAAMPKRSRDGLLKEIMALLEHADFAHLFAAGSVAEVPISAEIPAPSGKGMPLRVNGQIDRIAVTDSEIFIIDYKTNRPPPKDEEAVAPAYLLQLAAYRLVLRQIYPERNVQAALLWTYDSRIMPIAAELLDRCELRLFERGQGLDAL